MELFRLVINFISDLLFVYIIVRFFFFIKKKIGK